MGINAVNFGYHSFRRKEAGIYCPSSQHFLSNHHFERASYQYNALTRYPGKHAHSRFDFPTSRNRLHTPLLIPPQTAQILSPFGPAFPTLIPRNAQEVTHITENRNGKLQKFFIFLLTDCSFCGIIFLAVRKHPLHAEPMRWVSMDVTWVAKPRNRIT